MIKHILMHNDLCMHTISVLYKMLTGKCDPHRWAWLQINKNGDCVVSKKDIYRTLKRYNQHVSENCNIHRLIRKFDKNEDRILDAVEFQGLISVCDPQSFCPDESHCRGFLVATGALSSAVD